MSFLLIQGDNYAKMLESIKFFEYECKLFKLTFSFWLVYSNFIQQRSISLDF